VYRGEQAMWFKAATGWPSEAAARPVFGSTHVCVRERAALSVEALPPRGAGDHDGMFRLILCLTGAGICAVFGYVLGAALTGTWIAAVVLMLVLGGLGFVGCEALLGKAQRDEHPTTWKT
jgi:hypothetical protein